MMKIINQIERLKRIHQLIKAEKTGNPQQFARMLSVSESRLYRIIESLKDEGAPIDYSRSAQTYYYSAPFELEIQCRFIHLSEEESRDVNGGISYLPGFFKRIHRD